MSKENKLSRRDFLLSAAMTFAAARFAMIAPAGAPFKKETTMTQIAKQSTTPEGLGSVTGAPNLPAGFTDTFTSTRSSEARGRLCCWYTVGRRTGTRGAC